MFGKLFASMYDGTLGTKGPWQALVTFQQFVILSDKEGVVDMTADAIARRTSIPIEIITAGIAALELADPDSRSPDEDGRRITRLSDSRAWGWQITNYLKYREIRSAEERREYQRQYWHKRKDKKLNDSTETQQTQPIAVSSKQRQKQKHVEASLLAEHHDQVAVDLELALTHQFGPRWASVALFLDGRSAARRGSWVRELAKLAIEYDVTDIERACADAGSLEKPLTGARGLRAFVAGAKRERSNATAGTTTGGGAALVMGQIRSFVRSRQQPGQRSVQYIPRNEVEALGKDVLKAYDAIGGAERVLEASGEQVSFLIRDFTQALEAARVRS